MSSSRLRWPWSSLVLLLLLTAAGVAAAQPAPDDEAPGAEAGEEADAGADADGPAYPPEALELLPEEVLDALPTLVTRFLRAEHYQAIRQRCPEDDVAGVLACLGRDDVAEQLGTMVGHGVIATLLERMDVELPRRLSAEDFEILGERCTAEGEAWAACALEHGVDADPCGDGEEALARCLIDRDDVVDLYLAIADEKKRIFGKELYVEFAGLLAVLPVEAVTAARQACPQTDAGEAIACLAEHEVVGAVLQVYMQLARQVVEEAAKEAAAAGNAVDVEAYTDRLLHLFLTLPSHTIMSLAGACARQHPELETIASEADLDKGLECIAAAAKTDPVANPAYIAKGKLLDWLGVARAKVVDVIRKKEEAAQAKAFRRILLVLAILAGLGAVGVLLMPLVLARRYPGQGPLLWKASAVAAGTFAITVVLLGVSLLTVRTVQGAVATDSTSPKMRVADGAFAVLRKNQYVETFSELSKERLDFIKSPLRRVVEATGDQGAEEYAVFAAYLAFHWADLLDEPELKHLAKNAAKLQGQARSFKGVFGFYEKIDWIMGIVPIVLSLLAVVLYVVPLKGTLVEIVAAPARAAQGGAAAGGTIQRAMGTVWAEVKSALPFIGVILVLLPVVGVFLALAVEPLVELLIAYTLTTLVYLLFSEASTLVLYASLGGVIVLLVLCLAVYILTIAFFLGTSRKIFRAIFHGGHRFADFKRFWLWGASAAAWLIVVPFAYLRGILVLAEAFPPDVEALGARDMLLIPLLGLLLFPVLFWGSRAWAALIFIKTYPVPRT